MRGVGRPAVLPCMVPDFQLVRCAASCGGMPAVESHHTPTFSTMSVRRPATAVSTSLRSRSAIVCLPNGRCIPTNDRKPPPTAPERARRRPLAPERRGRRQCRHTATDEIRSGRRYSHVAQPATGNTFSREFPHRKSLPCWASVLARGQTCTLCS